MAETMTDTPDTDDAPQGMILSDSAAVKITELIEEEGDTALALRVAVRPGGCSGLSYEMYFDTEVAADDAVTENQGVRILVDPASLQYLAGAELDFRDQGLQGAGFAITNPNEQRGCGCGKSFC